MLIKEVKVSLQPAYTCIIKKYNGHANINTTQPRAIKMHTSYPQSLQILTKSPILPCWDFI